MSRQADGIGPLPATLPAWLRARRPTPPGEVLRIVEPYLADRSASSVGLAAGARSALEEALRRSPDQREGAYHLLAADALLTYALEAAAAEADCPGALEDLLRKIGGRDFGTE